MASINVDTPSAEGSSAKTNAQKVAEAHAAAETHNPTIEEVVDEEDLQHPPPSLSAKAAGKQRADNKPSGLNTQDEEAFPSLGPATKAPAAKAPGWGPKSSLKTTASPMSSGAATPNSAARKTTPGVSLPGQYVDNFEVPTADIDTSKSIDKVLQDVRRKYKVDVAIEDTGFGARRRFVAKGARAQVHDALIHISKELSVERKEIIEVPSVVSAQIIGKGGANIKQLEKDFGVKINVQRDSGAATAEKDGLRFHTVEIRGHSAAARLAKQKISNMVRELQPKVDMPLRNIPPEFYSFLKGRHASDMQKLEQENDVRIQIPNFHTWTQQPPPRPERDDKPPVYVPHGDSHIVVSGDSAATQQARQAIEQIAQQLQRELLLREYTCDQVLHPYLVGNRGVDPLKFLEETGCTIILPPASQTTDDIHILGPRDQLDGGIQRLDELMSQRQPRTLDLAKQFSDAPTGADRHSRALAQYLQQKAIQREFANLYGADVVFPAQSAGSTTWTVVTNEAQKAVAAKNDLAKVTQAFPTSRLNLVPVDPFYHSHLPGLHAENFRQQHGVHMIILDDDEDHVALIFEGPAQEEPFNLPRNRPSQSEVAAFQKALQAAQADLLASIPQQALVERELKAPRKHHDRVRKFVNSEAKSQSPFPVRVDYGAPTTARGKRSGPSSDSIYLRSPYSNDIDEYAQIIEQFLLQVEQDDKERGYTTTFDFPQKFVKNLVGKQGAQIKALREKHDVEIDTRETGKVKITGPQKKAEACKAEIVKMGKTFEDEVTYVIKVPSKFHGELIGKSGENLNRLQEKVNGDVRIDFPRAKGSNNVADNASEAGGPAQQAADEIKIRGPKAKADKVRDELLSLHQYLAEMAHTATISVAREQTRSLIGKGGSEIEKLRAETGAQIDVPNEKGDSEGGRVTVTIKGTKQAVDKAKAELAKRSKAFDSVVVKKITVDKKYRGDIIGLQGSNVRRIVVEAGGAEEDATDAVKFARQEDESNEVTIKGAEDVVNKIIASIQAIVEEKENTVTEIIDVPVDQHRNLIGSGGAIRRELEEKYKISLEVPKRDSGKTGVKVSGLAANVANIKEHIAGLTKQPESVVIEVPRGVHHVVAQNGQLFRQLNGQGIKVDHRGQKPPPRPQSNGGARSRNTNGAMPLITDEQGGDEHSFEIVKTGGESTEAGTIPWVLFSSRDGNEEKLARARKNIEDSIKRASVPQHTGYLILADPKLHRHVIGRGGNTINRIREKTDCDIQVPKGGSSQDEAITIVGDEAGVLQARDLILEEISRGSQGRE